MKLCFYTRLLFSEGTLSEPISLSAHPFFLFVILLSVFNKHLSNFIPLLVLVQMASRKRRASTSRPQEPYDISRFVSEVAWEHYEKNVHTRNILPERNVELSITQYDEFRQEL